MMPSNKALVDTGFLYALFNKTDKNHVQARRFAQDTELTPFIPEIVLPEVAFLFMRDGGHAAVATFLAQFKVTRPNLECLITEDISRAHEVMVSYLDSGFDFVDCAIMALAERLNITRVCTYDRRDFAIFRPAHCDYLELLP